MNIDRDERTGRVSARRQTLAAMWRYAPAILRCGYCARQERSSDPASRIFTTDDGSIRLCRRCIAATYDVISEAIDEGQDA
jgi:hypothetical protein